MSPSSTIYGIGKPCRGGMRAQVAPCWIILDEYNRVEMDKTYDFVSREPRGTVSAAFLREVAATIRKAVKTSALKEVKRT